MAANPVVVARGCQNVELKTQEFKPLTGLLSKEGSLNLLANYLVGEEGEKGEVDLGTGTKESRKNVRKREPSAD